jgi:hypothetical protein
MSGGIFLTFKEVPIYMGRPKKKGIIVIGDYAIDKAIFIEPSTLRLCLRWRDDVRQAKVLQQLLALPAQAL